MKEKFRWCEDLITFLISLYRKHKLLYNADHPDYCNRIKRERAMTSILAEIQKVNPNVRMHFLKAKICNLRTQYMRERKKALIALKNDGSSDEKYEPTLWCYPQLTFLKKHCKNKQLIPNIDKDYCSPVEEEEEEEEEEDNQPAVNNTFATVYPENLHNNVVASPDVDTYVTPDTLHPNGSHFTNVIPDIRIVSCNSLSQGNGVIASSDINNYPASNRLNPNTDNLEHELKQQIDNIKEVLANRVHNKNQNNKYDWLGKQVVFEINKINNEVLQEETAWAIQSILRKNVCKDRSLQHQELYRSQNQNHVSSTPKTVHTTKPLRTNSNAVHDEDPLAEAMQGVIDEDCY